MSVFDADGSSIVIHVTADDNVTDPAGNSGIDRLRRDRALMGSQSHSNEREITMKATHFVGRALC